MKRSGLPAADPLRALGDRLHEALDAVIESWPEYGTSDHLRLEIAAAFDANRTGSLPSVDAMLAQGVADIDPRTRRWYLDKFAEPSALALGEPVPGCGCPECTGISADHPVRQRQLRQRKAGHERFAEVLERVRQIPIIQGVKKLGLGEPVRRGKSVMVRCPLHDDRRPSMAVDPGRGLWYCFPCSEGGDGIMLYMKARRLGFAEAVRELAEYAGETTDRRAPKLTAKQAAFVQKGQR